MLVRRWAAMLAAGLALTAVTACSGSDDAPPKVDGAVVQPGRPGEKSKILEEAPEIEVSQANSADIVFATMMIPHHAQALEMSDLAVSSGAGRDVQVLADRISGAQKPEIVYLAGWLEDRGEDAPTLAEIDRGDMGNMAMGHGGHSGDSPSETEMPGMATSSQLAKLAEARGPAFDTLYLTLMISHHQGAVDMAGDVLRGGSEQQLNELASGVAADQSAEITRMKDLLGG